MARNMNVLTLFSCHSNTSLKIKAILHNLNFLFELSSTVVLINSREFKGILEPKLKNRKSTIVNNVLTDELCFAYKHAYPDLRHLSNVDLKQHWIEYGMKEERVLPVPTQNLYLEYTVNDQYSSKWMSYLNKNDCSAYDRVVLTHDSILITRSLKDIMNPAEMVALVDSNQNGHHYPDFLRVYNQSGLQKIKQFYETKKASVTNTFMKTYEIESSHIFESVHVLFKSPKEPVNIHFDNALLADYLYLKNYPVVEIKKMMSNDYANNDLPFDFNSSEYKKINADLAGMTDEEAVLHFIHCGAMEGRLYQENQPLYKLELLENYLKLVGFQ